MNKQTISDILCDLYDIRNMAMLDGFGNLPKDNEDDLIEEITAASGWCIKSIDYEIQLK